MLTVTYLSNGLGTLKGAVLKQNCITNGKKKRGQKNAELSGKKVEPGSTFCCNAPRRNPAKRCFLLGDCCDER